VKRLGLLLAIPALGLVLAAALVVSTHAGGARLRDDGRHAFETHVASVVKLTREAARQGAAAVDLLYVLAEDELAAAAELRAHLGPDEGTEGVVRDRASEQFVVRDRVRARTDEVHVPAQDVPELGQLVEVEPPEPSTKWGDAIFVVPLPFRGSVLHVTHRAELEEAKSSTMQSYALLNEEHGTLAGQVDG
jgi:hypothetical protein